MIYKQTKFVFFTRLSSTSMCPCSETLLTPGVMCKSCPLSTFRRQRVNLSAPFLWTRAKMWDLSESKHICPSPLLSYKRSEEANMYNARGRLQLMHLSCCQGGKKTPSQTPIFHTSQGSVSPVLESRFSPCLLRGVSARRWCSTNYVKDVYVSVKWWQ